MSRNMSDTQNMALYCDFENVALGVKEARYEQFDIGKILERLLLKGSIVVKKAYCDWDRYKDFKASMHQASFEMIEIPHVRMSGKNSADIRMVVDALDLCYTKAHVDTFVIISGDSDFSPLVSKLRENNKTVIGVGVKNSTSDLLIANCDEFIFYDDLVREQRGRTSAVAKARATRKKVDKPERNDKADKPERADAAAAGRPEKAGRSVPPEKDKDGSADRKERGAPVSSLESTAYEPLTSDEALAEPLGLGGDGSSAPPTAAEREERTLHGLELVMETLEALLAERGEDERIWGSMIKQTLKRRNPGFNELYYGFKSFNRMLEEARDRNLIRLEDDDKSGGYIVRAV